MSLERILLPVNESDKDNLDALAAAVSDVAGPADASVELFHVFTDSRFADAAASLDYDDPNKADPVSVANRQTVVRDLRDRLEEAGIDVDLKATVGDVGDSIVEEAERFDADLVIIGGRSRSPAGKAVFGSTVQSVMLNAPCPVTFVRAD